MADPNGPNGQVAYSMVLVGKITGKRLNDCSTHTRRPASPTAGQTVYSIPSEGRTVRVAQIGYDMVAVSRTPRPRADTPMLDRHSTAAWPFERGRCPEAAFHDVPLALAGAELGQIGLPFFGDGPQYSGFCCPLEADSTIIARRNSPLSAGRALLNVKVGGGLPPQGQGRQPEHDAESSVDHGRGMLPFPWLTTRQQWAVRAAERPQ